MFKEERIEFKFNWSMLGDIEKGRMNLGPNTTVAMYRLMQYTLRDSLIKHIDVATANRIFHDAGFNAGEAIYSNLLDDPPDFDTLVKRLQASLKKLKVGILRIEEADLDKLEFTLTVAEDLDCSGLPVIDEAICTFDEGLIAGILSAYTGNRLTAKEIDCWGTGERVCRFKASISENA